MPDTTTTAPEVTEILARDDVKAAVEQIVNEKTAGLTAKRDELFSTVGELKKTVSQIEELGGIDTLKTIVTNVKEAERKAQEAALKTAESEGNIQAIKDAHAAQLKEREAEIQRLKQTAVDRETRIQLNKSISKAKGISEILEPVLSNRVRGSYKDDGTIKVEVLSATGVPQQNNDGSDATIDDLINELRENPSFAGAFAGTGSGGMGSRGSEAGGSNEVNPFDKTSGHFNLTKQAELFRQDPAKARALAAKVGITLG